MNLVSKRQKTGSGPAVTISTTDVDNIKVGIGKSGVVLPFYKRPAYLELSNEQ